MEQSEQIKSTASPNSRMCRAFLRGTCKQGSNCLFSHGSVAKSAGGPSAVPMSSKSSSSPSAEKTLQKKEQKKAAAKKRLSKGGEALIEYIESPANLKIYTEEVRLEASEFLASYNWAPSKRPTIYVPGSPARWKPPTLPIQLYQDQGQVFVSQNQKRSPAESFMPFFAAFHIMQPDFDMSTIDLITDRNSLRKLLNWSEGRVTSPWRIEVDIVGDTMIFTRWEANPTQMLSGTSAGFGHEFEKCFTALPEDLKESTGHHRIVKYTLGALQLLVRFEVDGYLASPADENESHNYNLAADLEKINIQTPPTDLIIPPGNVKVIRAGHLIDSTSLLEVKTRGKGNSIQLSQVMPQLYFSQTPHLYTAFHTTGYIADETKIRKFAMDAEEFRKWEDRKQDALKKLIGLISYVKELTEGKGGQFLMVCEKGEGGSKKGIQLLERSGKAIGLPATARKVYWPGSGDVEDTGVSLKTDV